MYTTFSLTHEVGTGGRRRKDSGHGDPPGPRPACPSAGWGGSGRTPPSLVWDCTLETTALEEAAERKISPCFFAANINGPVPVVTHKPELRSPHQILRQEHLSMDVSI